MERDRRLKEGATWMWSLGDYREIAGWLLPCAEALMAAVGAGEGMTVLDVAAGNGNAAIAAARRGATVIASDLTPHMVELGHTRSVAEHLTIEWREADAEALPFHAGSFDIVASVFGAMFAPRPERVAAELFRVAKPGACIAMANYASEGFLGQFAALITRYAPAAPDAFPSPFRWGDADEVRRRFQGLASSVATEHRTLTFAFDTVAEGLAFWERTNGPLIALKSLLPAETYRAARDETIRLLTEANRADNGRLTLESAYLQVIARKKR